MKIPVFCYRNLNRKGVVWSVKHRRIGLVIARGPTFHLSNVKLVVSQAGRARVLKEKRKNVHAGVTGSLIKRSPSNLKWRRVQYNPYVNNTFVDTVTGESVTNVKYAKLTKKGLFVSN